MKNHPKYVVRHLLLIMLIQMIGISSTQASDLFLVLEGTISSNVPVERQPEKVDDGGSDAEMSLKENLQASLTQPNSRSELRALDEPPLILLRDGEEQQLQR